jgi:hypothetical protein
MKIIIFVIVILFSGLTSFSQDISNLDLTRIYSQTQRATLPFNTRDIDLEQAKSLKKETLFNSLLKNDTSKYYYTISIFDNDLRKNVTRTTNFDYYAIGKVKLNQINLLIYSKLWHEREKIILATCTNSNRILDTLKIGYEKGGDNLAVTKYTESKINQDLSIDIKTIALNPKHTKENLKENPDIPKSIVEKSYYKINKNTGEISFVKKDKETYYTHCSPSEYTYKSDCKIFSSDSLQNP